MNEQEKQDLYDAENCQLHIVSGLDQLNEISKLMASEASFLAAKKRPKYIKFFIGDFHGCGHWRCMYPTIMISSLREDAKCVYDYAFSPGDQSLFRSYDLLILQRQVQPGFKEGFQHFLKMREENKLPVAAVFEIDDWLFGIPEYNMAHDLYHNKLGEKHLAEVLSTFDGMIVSTDYLKKMYSKYVDYNKIWVMKNYMPRMLWDFHINEKKDFSLVDTENNKPRILFAGGANRFAVAGENLIKRDDISQIEPLIRKTVDEWQWVFMGAQPLRLMDLFAEKKIEHVPWQSNFNYPRYLRDHVKCDLAISPLLDHAFNRSKSNIKILEYGAVGIPGIYTKLECYKELPDWMKVLPGDTAGWETKIREHLKSKELRAKNQAEQLKILEQYWLEDNLDTYIETYQDIINTVRKNRKLIKERVRK